MNIYTSEIEFLKTEVQRLRALVRAQQITIDKLEAQRTWSEGREQAFSEIAEKMKLMPWGSDTMHSFLIWLGEQK